MEDMFCVAYQPTADDRDLLYAYFGIFDGHGGREAALYAKHHLMDQIVQQKNFWSDDDDLVLKAIRDGFITTHQAMWKELETWPKTPSGLPSTSGTTASIAFVRRGKLYIGHVGDSGIVMGYEDPETGFWRAKSLTKDHKPESAAESSRINHAGGKVIVKSGVPRVVWNRPRIGHQGPVRRSTLIDEIPFLAVARSLGDLWSYNSKQNEYIVSPEPDVSVVEIDVHSHRCLILGTDGLWNMLSAQEAVNSVYFAEKNNERQPVSADPTLAKNWINPSKRLVDRALDRWLQHNLRADNTSVVTVVVDPPGPPKGNHMIRHSFSSSQDSSKNRPLGVSHYVPNRAAIVSHPIAQKAKEPVAPVSSASPAVPSSSRLPSPTSQQRVSRKTATKADTLSKVASSANRVPVSRKKKPEPLRKKSMQRVLQGRATKRTTKTATESKNGSKPSAIGTAALSDRSLRSATRKAIRPSRQRSK